MRMMQKATGSIILLFSPMAVKKGRGEEEYLLPTINQAKPAHAKAGKLPCMPVSTLSLSLSYILSSTSSPLLYVWLS